MVEQFLKSEVQEFINKNINSDVVELALRKHKFEGIRNYDLINQIEAKKKSKFKLPTWFKTKKIVFPSKVSIEQSTSETIAKIKSMLFSGKSGIDLTGGFGIDTFFLSSQFESFTYCEKQPELFEITKHNFTILNKNNIEFKNIDGIEFIKHHNKIFDLIYIDPSRRSANGNRVFLLSDIEPNPSEHINLLRKKGKTIVIKLSPMLDIKNTINQLENVSKVYIISQKNQVKEMLILIENDHKNLNATIEILEINRNNIIENDTFELDDSKFVSSFSQPQNFLYEPLSAILKAGAFNQISVKHNINKLAIHSHLYTSEKFISNFKGKVFKIIAKLKPNNELKKLHIKERKINIVSKNFNLSVSEICKKYKFIEGGKDYLFFTKDTSGKNVVIYAEQINS